MTSDVSKGITAFICNHLTLPPNFTFNNGWYIKITYDATGKKLRKAANKEYLKGAKKNT